MADKNVDTKNLLRMYGIFVGFVAFFTLLLIGMIKLSQKSWKTLLKEKVEVVLQEKQGDNWIVGNFLEQKTPFAVSSAVYELHNKNNADIYYAVIIRGITLYGPVPAVFIYNKKNGAEFVGFSGVHGRVQKIMEFKSNTRRISYWNSKIPSIVNNAGGN